MKRNPVGLAIACLVCGIFPGTALGASRSPKAAALNRTALEVQQGRDFRWALPKGWSAKETANGVDLSSLDEKTLVSSALLHGGFGQMTPRDFAAMILPQVNPTARIESSVRLPSQPGILGPWQSEDFFDRRNPPTHAGAYACHGGIERGLRPLFGSHDLYQAPATTWNHDKLWLPAVAQSIVVVNARKVAGQDSVMLPRNNPLDNSGLIESWRQKGLSEDRISQGRREGTMGYQRFEDPNTSQRYELPLEAYDAKVGGYHNPTQPTELLEALAPGE